MIGYRDVETFRFLGDGVGDLLSGEILLLGDGSRSKRALHDCCTFLAYIQKGAGGIAGVESGRAGRSLLQCSGLVWRNCNGTGGTSGFEAVDIGLIGNALLLSGLAETDNGWGTSTILSMLDLLLIELSDLGS